MLSFGVDANWAQWVTVVVVGDDSETTSAFTVGNYLDLWVTVVVVVGDDSETTSAFTVGNYPDLWVTVVGDDS